MSDCFELLGVARRPWLDEEELKARFMELSAVSHPDRVHQDGAEEKQSAHDRFSALNQAYQRLRDPKDRLLHLLELELRSELSQVERLPSGAMDTYLAAGQACRECDGFLAERAATTSPMVKLRFFEQGMEWVDRIQGYRRQMESTRESLFNELKTMNQAWEGPATHRATLPVARLEEIYRELSYLLRWINQLQDRLVRLTL